MAQDTTSRLTAHARHRPSGDPQTWPWCVGELVRLETPGLDRPFDAWRENADRIEY